MYKINFIIFFLSVITQLSTSQTFRDVKVNSSIDKVQPMTGIVLWTDNIEKNNTDAISLEFSYMKYNDIVKQKGIYDWTVLENTLNSAASRNHQAIIRFYFVYPVDKPLRDGKTTVPDYIKNMEGYTDFKGKGDGSECYFPDWRNTELQNFTLEFYTKLAEKYDNDPRLAFLQTGFGLWAEYHTWSGEFTLNGTKYKESKMVGIGFPSKAYQETFLKHLNSVFINTPWSISIDASDGDYTPVEEKPELKNLNFGLFDDSFMSEEHDTWNKLNWQFFGSDKYRKSPAGGEFNYYTDADQKGVLEPKGWRGRTYEQASSQYHISYMIGNDQPKYRTMDRIKEAGMANGYKFNVESFKVSDLESKVIVKNIGVAPIYHDAFVTVNGVKSNESLKHLYPGESKEYSIMSGGDNPILTITSDRLLPGQTIQFKGNTTAEMPENKTNQIQYKIIGKQLYISTEEIQNKIKITDLTGKTLLNKIIYNGENIIPLKNFHTGIYILEISSCCKKKIYLD